MKRSAYSKFRSTGAALTSQSNYAKTLINRQNAAEDDYNDYAYSSGAITADQYITNLNQRKARAGQTPLQTQNLTQKITDVQETYQDSLIQTAYKTGATYNGEVINTTYVYNREKAKLDKMTPGSDAFNKQQALVDTYSNKIVTEKDAAEKATRKQYRVDESLKISTMRQETSAELTAKANMYEKLEAMARADGDTQDATTLETNKNNLKQAASRAAVNERIQDVVVKNSTPVDPMSAKVTTTNTNQTTTTTPTNNNVAPNGGNATVEGQVETPATSDETQLVEFAGIQMDKKVYDELISSSEISNYQKAITLATRKVNGETGKNNGLNSAIASQQNLVNVYKTEMDNASADNKDTLIKGYNDSVERLNTLVQQREDALISVEDKTNGFQEVVAKKAASIMKNQDATFERAIDTATKKTQDDFAAGKIPLETYIQDMYNNNKAGATRFERQSKLFEQVNDGVGLSTSTQKMNLYNESLDYINTEIIPNKDNLRVVQVDETNNDKINLAKGQSGVRKGEYIIENPTAGAADETDAAMKLKEWDNSHAQVGGVWFPVRLNFDAVDKELTSEESKTAFAEKNNLYIYKKIVDGKETNVPIKAVDYGDNAVKYYSKELVDKQVASGSLKKNGEQIINLGGDSKGDFNIFKSAGEEIKRNVANPSGMIQNIKDNVKGLGSSIGKGFNAMMENSAPVVFGDAIFGKTVPKEKPGTSFNLPKFSLVKPAFAVGNENPVESVKAVPIATMNNGDVKMSDGTIVPQNAFNNNPVATSTGSGIKTSNANQTAFLARFDKEAEAAAQKYGVPKSVILAVAGHESGFNPNAQTLFGIKGAGVSLPTWEVVNGQRVEVNANFRKYNNTQSAFDDFAKLIATDPRYANAYANKDNPTRMVQEIKKAGYATDPLWDKKVNSYISAAPASQPAIKATSANPIKTAIAAIVKPVYAAENNPMPQSSSNNNQSFSNPAPVTQQKVTPTPQQNASVNPALGYHDPVKQQSVMSPPAWTLPKAQVVAPKPIIRSTPAPAPVSQPKTSFIDQAKNTVKNVISSISSWFKKK